MSFASLTFVIFLAAVFLVHWAVPRVRWQNAVLALASVVFYGWWDWRFCGLLIASALVDFALGRALGTTAAPRRRRLLLGLSVVFNLGLLGTFKYFGFFADSFALALAALGWETSWTTLHLILPIGISFYTFQTLSYTIDIYRRHFEPQRDLLAYLAFVGFFPQLVAGPIERASHLLPQFLRGRAFDPAEAAEGLRFILWGLLKKMVLADNLAALVTGPFATPGVATPASLVLATVAFAFQIYCDFSGYSDIAVGAGRLFGIRLVRNFACPYLATSITEFWRRWHISMSTWFRDYVYIPLGGSRGPASATTRNLLLTTGLSGLWHGAAWHFVAWGLLHGIYLVAERHLQWRTVPGPDPGTAISRPTTSILPPLMAGLRTFALVGLAWVLFRVDAIDDAFLIYGRIGRGLLSVDFYVGLAHLVVAHRWPLLGIAGLMAAEFLQRQRWHPLAMESWPRLPRWVAYTTLTWAILLLGTSRVGEFIYFQF